MGEAMAKDWTRLLYLSAMLAPLRPFQIASKKKVCILSFSLSSFLSRSYSLFLFLSLTFTCCLLLSLCHSHSSKDKLCTLPPSAVLSSCCMRAFSLTWISLSLSFSLSFSLYLSCSISFSLFLSFSPFHIAVTCKVCSCSRLVLSLPLVLCSLLTLVHSLPLFVLFISSVCVYFSLSLAVCPSRSYTLSVFLSLSRAHACSFPHTRALPCTHARALFRFSVDHLPSLSRNSAIVHSFSLSQ